MAANAETGRSRPRRRGQTLVPLKARVSPPAKDRAESWAARLGVPVSELMDRILLELPLDDSGLPLGMRSTQTEFDLALAEEEQLKTAS